MGFSLRGRNGTTWRTACFSWSWIMESGVGLSINHGRAAFGDTVHEPQANGKPGSPCTNDGYYVPAERARAMGYAALGLAAIQAFINEEWEALTPDERAAKEATLREHPTLYRKPVRADFVKKAEAFGNFALKSRGFWIR